MPETVKQMCGPIGAALAALLTLAGCDPEPATTYPISGEECAPDDPVRDLDAADCAPVSVGVM